MRDAGSVHEETCVRFASEVVLGASAPQCRAPMRPGVAAASGFPEATDSDDVHLCGACATADVFDRV